ncbi:MAG: 30S ribosomal protein S27ae [Nanoarchaeota archaeon]
MADENAKSYQMYKLYEVKDGKITRKNKFSPKAGDGYFMAEHKDRRTCGKTGYTEMKGKEE